MEHLRLMLAGQFMPHGSCYLWNPGLIWLRTFSDGAIALAYYSVPFELAYFARKRRDLPFPWIFWMFVIFIFACGTTHLIEVWTIWHPIYWIAGGVKALTAVGSVATAVALVRLIPQALAFQSEDKFRGLLEAAPDAIVIVDRQGCIALVNKQAEKLFGYSREELLDNSVEMLIPPRFRDNDLKYRAGYFTDPKARAMGSGLELCGLRKDRTEFPVEISLSPLETVEGTLISSAIRDITALDLTRFRRRCWGKRKKEFPNAKNASTICAGIPAPDHRAGARRT